MNERMNEYDNFILIIIAKIAILIGEAASANYQRTMASRLYDN